MKPILFLDFDRTLFDTDAFYLWLGPNRVERLAQVVSSATPAPDFRTYLYPDTIDFLRTAHKTHRLVLLTYTVNTALQEKKVRESGVLPFFDDVLMAQGEEGNRTGKGTLAHAYVAAKGASGHEHLFVDDTPQNIDEVKRMNPAIRCVRIDRTEGAHGILHNDLLAPDLVVGSLGELQPLL